MKPNDMGDAFGPGASLQSSISAAPPIAEAATGNGLTPLPKPAEYFVFAGLDWHRATESYFAQMHAQTSTLALYTADQMRAYAEANAQPNEAGAVEDPRRLAARACTEMWKHMPTVTAPQMMKAQDELEKILYAAQAPKE